MTGILSNQLPGRANPPDADNPLGSFKDRTAPGANDGSYLTQTWSNDRDSLLQALFIASGLTPNGIEDTGTASQLFDALVNNRWSSIGNYSLGSIVVASDGNEYKCVQANGRDTSVIDPATVTNRNFWVRYPYDDLSTASEIVKVYHDNTVLIEGSVSGLTFNTTLQSVPVSIPASISLDASYNVFSQVIGIQPGTAMQTSPESTTATGFTLAYTATDTLPIQSTVHYLINGKLA